MPGGAEVRTLDPYAEAKRMHPSSLPPLEDAERDGRGAVVLAFPARAARSASGADAQSAEPVAVAQL